MSKRKHAFVSDIDQKLAAFDSNHPRSAAQQTEYDKYQDIYQKRDNIHLKQVAEDNPVWDDF